jgi:hypothetical protein
MTLYVNRQAKQAAVALIEETAGCVLRGLKRVLLGALGTRSGPLQDPKAMEIVEIVAERTVGAKSITCFFKYILSRQNILGLRHDRKVFFCFTGLGHENHVEV